MKTYNPGNTAQFKIDKRGQIVGYAMDWADYYAYQRANAADEEERDKWENEGPSGLWGQCFSFAGHIYGRFGLDISAGDGSGMFGAATASDESLSRFYTSASRAITTT